MYNIQSNTKIIIKRQEKKIYVDCPIVIKCYFGISVRILHEMFAIHSILDYKSFSEGIAIKYRNYNTNKTWFSLVFIF